MSIEALSGAVLQQAALYLKWRARAPERAPGPLARHRETGLTNSQAVVYAHLHRLALEGAPAPSDAALAADLAFDSTTSSYTMAILKRRGLIRTRRHRGYGREIWVCAGNLYMAPAKRILVPGACGSCSRLATVRSAAPTVASVEASIGASLVPATSTAPAIVDTLASHEPDRFRLYDQSRDGPRRLWPVVAFLRDHGERIVWQGGRYIAGTGYGRLSPADLVRRANVVCIAQGRMPFPSEIADREVAA